jgi:predicted metal-dependent enzyme (double-stranded beta helix superfamily)
VIADKLQTFVDTVTAIVGEEIAESALLERIKPRLAELVAKDDWLPQSFSVPHPTYYQQYLLHCDPQQRFCVVSFVWGPGQKTPVHDHTVWGLIGMLRGAEIGTSYACEGTGAALRKLGVARLEPGEIDMVSPTIGDIHQVQNAYDDRVSISIHVYGANIGAIRRHVYDVENGAMKEFISGFSS